MDQKKEPKSMKMHCHLEEWDPGHWFATYTIDSIGFKQEVCFAADSPEQAACLARHLASCVRDMMCEEDAEPECTRHNWDWYTHD